MQSLRDRTAAKMATQAGVGIVILCVIGIKKKIMTWIMPNIRLEVTPEK